MKDASGESECNAAKCCGCEKNAGIVRCVNHLGTFTLSKSLAVTFPSDALNILRIKVRDGQDFPLRMRHIVVRFTPTLSAIAASSSEAMV